MTSSATTQTYILGLGLVYIYPLFDLLECTKGLVLWNNNLIISMTLGDRRLSEVRFIEFPEMVVCQRP